MTVRTEVVEGNSGGITSDGQQLETVLDRLEGYSAFDSVAAHLRPHQIQAVEAFRQTGAAILNGELRESGMGIIHPTGSGKSVIGAELVRMVCIGAGRSQDEHLSALWLTPRHTIGGQIIGDERGMGAIQRFVPGATVGEYSGWRKELGRDVTVMTYQNLAKAIESGDFGEVDPSLIVCDEVHHVIDGAWARAVKEACVGRLVVGLTATPDYSDKKNISGLFKHELARKTMREGIKEGILSDLRGSLYKGKSIIKVQRMVGGDFADDDLFDAIADSEDNFQAAKLCVEEVIQGRRGIIACVPGHDRAHAKIMAEILNRITVEAEGGPRKIRAAYVGGELSRKDLNTLLDAYKAGELDVLCQVDLLSEGWDSPETDFLISMRPTTSKVLATQRLGRILRPRENKMATVHEFVYDIYGQERSQVTYDEVLDGRASVEQSFVPNKPHIQNPTVQSFNADTYEYDPLLPVKVAQAKVEQTTTMDIEIDKDTIPYDWLTPELAARMVSVDIAVINGIAKKFDLASRSLTVGDRELTYYPPMLVDYIVKELEIKTLAQTELSLHALTAYHKESSDTQGLVTPYAVRQLLLGKGHSPELRVDSTGGIVEAYPKLVKKVILLFHNTREAVKDEQPIARKKEIKHTPTEVIDWLSSILIHPEDPDRTVRSSVIAQAQKRLIEILRTRTNAPSSSYQKLEAFMAENGITPSNAMLNVMRAQKISFGELIYAAGAARAHLASKGLA